MPTSTGSQGRGPDEERIFLERLEQISRRGARDERYRVLGEIAHGGMGRVLRVYDEDLRRELAMKVIRLGAAPIGSSGAGSSARENLALFLEEVQITAQLNHQSVVPVHDIGVNARGELYYLMPLLRGIDLRAGIDAMRRGEDGWTLPRIVDVLCRTAQAVEHAHQRGVVHRDLKPANVMIGDLGEIWVLDWGLAQLQRVPFDNSAKEIDSETHLLLRTGGLVGTPGYMAPEQVDADVGPTGPRSDVYALGAILYHVLTGQMPYATPGPECAADTVVQRTLAGPPRRVHECAPDAQAELVAICEKAMQREAALRYASALAMAQDLRAWLEGRVVSTYGVGMLGVYRKWRRRNRAAARAVDTIAALLILGSIALSVQEHMRVLAVERAHLEEMRANNAANLRAADLSVRGRDSREALRLLELCPPTLRDWEWDWLHAQSDTSLERFDAHGASVVGLATDAAGRRALSWDSGGGVRLWDFDAHTGRAVAVPPQPGPGHSMPMALAPSGRACALAREAGRLCVIDLSNDALLREFQIATPELRALCWSPDGRWIAYGDAQGCVAIIDAETGLPACAPLLESAGDSFGQRALCFSPSGMRLACVSYNGVTRVWDWRDEPRTAPLELGSGGAWSACFSPDERRLLVAGRDRAARLYELATGTLEHEFVGHEREVRAAVFTRDGTRIVTAGSDESACVWKLGGNEPEDVLIGHTGTVHGLALVANADEILSCSADHTLRLWPLRPRERTTRLVPAPPLQAMTARASDGRLFGVTRQGAVVSLEPDASLEPDSSLEQGTPTNEDGVHASAQDASAIAEPVLDVRCAVFDAENAHALIGTGDGELVMKRIDDGAIEWRERVFENATTTVALDPSGLFVAAVADDSALCVLDRRTRTPLLALPKDANRVLALAFSPREPWLAIAREHSDVTWIEPFAGGRTRSLELANRHVNVNILCWRADGGRLAAGSMDGSILIVDPSGDAAPLELVGHGQMLTALQFAPNASRLYSTSIDRTMRVWDPHYPAPLLTLDGANKLGPLALDLEHGRVAVADYVRGVADARPITVWTLPALHSKTTAP